jgi:t-SNARE complex subunit (syntaxin)
MLEQITDDTKIRKSQTKKIKLFSVGFVILSLIILVLSYKSIYSEEILTSS